MPNLSKKTIKRLHAVLDYLKEEPKRFDMNHWGIKFDPSDPKQVKLAKNGVNTLDQVHGHSISARASDIPPCGTAGCLAGTTVLLFATPKELTRLSLRADEDKNIIIFGNDTEDVALNLLGISDRRIFFTWRWPEKFQTMYEAAEELKTPKRRATARYSAVKALIDAYIEQNGNWDDMLKKYAE